MKRALLLLSRFFNAIIALLLISCSRSENGAVVPESLPYVAVRTSDTRLIDFHNDIAVSYDSSAHEDRVQFLSNNPDSIFQKGATRAIYALCSSNMSWSDQITFSLAQYPGLERVAMLPATFDANNNGSKDVFFFLQFPDSIVLCVYDFATAQHWIVDASFARPENHYAIALALWRVPQTGQTFFVFRKSNRLKWKDRTLDTLYFFDLQAQRIAFQTPSAPLYFPFENMLEQRDSLLLLQSWDPKNGLSYDGFDDAHSYVLAYRPNGQLAWADTLLSGEGALPQSMAAFDDATNLFAYAPATAGHTPSHLHTILHANGQRLLCAGVPSGMIPIHMHHGSQGAEDVLDIEEGGTTIRAFDSAFTLKEVCTLPVKLGVVVGTENNGVEDYSTHSLRSGVMETDVNNDGAGEFLRTTATGQLLVIDGASLQPLAASPAYNQPMKYSFVRRNDGTTGVLIAHGGEIELLLLSPTPLWTRIAAQGAMRLWITAIIVLLPLGAYAARRINYLRLLFLHLSSRSENQGVVVIRRSGHIISINSAAARMLSLPKGKHTKLETLPDEIKQTVTRTSKRGATETCNVVIPGLEPRYLSVSSASLNGIGRIHLVVLTITDVTAFVEAELRRNLLSVALATGHDAKNKLGAVQLRLDAIMEYVRREQFADQAWLDRQESAAGASIDSVRDDLYKLLYTANIPDSNKRMCDIGEVVQQWINQERTRFERKGMVLYTECQEILPELNLETRHLHMLFACACENASHAMPESQPDKSVHFETRVSNNAVVLTMADNGCGMDERTLLDLRSPYFTTKSTGTGLGMMIMRKVCVEHGAQLEIESSPGHGTQLKVIFPFDNDLQNNHA